MKRTPFVNIFILIAFLVNTLGPVPVAQAQELRLPVPGVMVHLSPPENPPVLKGVIVYPNNPFKFDFILDKGDNSSVIASEAKQSQQEQLKQESTKLVKYFLAAITTPENDLWVNLSPYEKNRIIPTSFGQTDMGRDLLAEDYILKQITASLIYPEGEIGKQFWKRVYEEAQKKFGTSNIPVNTFNKVWIVPDRAKVYEHGNTAFVVKAKLKVMLEQDYLSLSKHVSLRGAEGDAAISDRTINSNVSTLGSQIVREIVIPQLEKEVNEDKNFATLRQVYYSLILAVWFKKRMKDSILGRKYMDQNKVKGIHYESLVSLRAGVIARSEATKQSFLQNDTDLIYQRYLRAFKKGVYNYIKEDPDPTTGEMIPRKYFSGGAQFNEAMKTTTFSKVMTIDEKNMTLSTEDYATVAVNLAGAQLAKPATKAMKSEYWHVGDILQNQNNMEQGIVSGYSQEEIDGKMEDMIIIQGKEGINVSYNFSKIDSLYKFIKRGTLKGILKDIDSPGIDLLANESKFSTLQYMTWRITSNGKMLQSKEAVSSELLSPDKIIEPEETEFINADDVDDAEPFMITSGSCTFLIIYNSTTRETFVAHSDGAFLNALDKILREAQIHFKGQEDKVLFIIGGRQLGRSEMKDAKFLHHLFGEQHKLIDKAKNSGFKVVKAFSQYEAISIIPVFDPKNRILVLERELPEHGALQKWDRFLPNENPAQSVKSSASQAMKVEELVASWEKSGASVGGLERIFDTRTDENKTAYQELLMFAALHPSPDVRMEVVHLNSWQPRYFQMPIDYLLKNLSQPWRSFKYDKNKTFLSKERKALRDKRLALLVLFFERSIAYRHPEPHHPVRVEDYVSQINSFLKEQVENKLTPLIDKIDKNKDFNRIIEATENDPSLSVLGEQVSMSFADVLFTQIIRFNFRKQILNEDDPRRKEYEFLDGYIDSFILDECSPKANRAYAKLIDRIEFLASEVVLRAKKVKESAQPSQPPAPAMVSTDSFLTWAKGIKFSDLDKQILSQIRDLQNNKAIPMKSDIEKRLLTILVWATRSTAERFPLIKFSTEAQGWKELKNEVRRDPLYHYLPSLLADMLKAAHYRYLPPKLSTAIIDYVRVHHIKTEGSTPFPLFVLNPNFSFYREFTSPAGKKVSKVIYFLKSENPQVFTIAEFFFLEGNYIGYGHANLTPLNRHSLLDEKLDCVRLSFNIFDRQGELGLARAIFKERLKEFAALIPNINGVFQITGDQYDKDINALYFYAGPRSSFGFRSQDPQDNEALNLYFKAVNRDNFLELVKSPEYASLFSGSLIKPVDLAQSSPENQAMKVIASKRLTGNGPGGIDLTAKRMHLEVDSDKAQRSSQPMNLQVLEGVEINGLYIKDIEIKPLNNLAKVLGVAGG